MKTTHDTFAAFLAAVKVNLSGWYVLLALLLLSVLFSGCEREDMAVCPVPEDECTTEVTAEQVMCGKGAFDSIWFKTEDGKYLQPWVNKTGVENIVAGHKYRIGFQYTTKDGRYSNVITCQAAVPEAEAAVITCIRAVSTI